MRLHFRLALQSFDELLQHGASVVLPFPASDLLLPPSRLNVSICSQTTAAVVANSIHGTSVARSLHFGVFGFLRRGLPLRTGSRGHPVVTRCLRVLFRGRDVGGGMGFESYIEHM